MPPTPPKAIRDDVPRVIRDNGDEPIVRIADPEEFVRLLRDKLPEELGEFLDSPHPGDPRELADFVDVAYAYASQALGLTPSQLDELRAVTAERVTQHEVSALRHQLDEFLGSPFPGDPSQLAATVNTAYGCAWDLLGVSPSQLDELRAAKTRECGRFTRRLVWLGNEPR